MAEEKAMNVRTYSTEDLQTCAEGIKAWLPRIQNSVVLANEMANSPTAGNYTREKALKAAGELGDLLLELKPILCDLQAAISNKNAYDLKTAYRKMDLLHTPRLAPWVKT